MNVQINSSITLEDFLHGNRFCNVIVSLKGSGALPPEIIETFLNECGPICFIAMQQHIFSKLLGFEMTIVGPGEILRLGSFEEEAPISEGSILVFRVQRAPTPLQWQIIKKIMPFETQMMFARSIVGMGICAVTKSKCNNVSCKCLWMQ